MNDINFFSFLMNLAITVLCGSFFLIVPSLTRKSYLFGIKIPEAEHGCEEAKALKKSFLTICVAGMVVVAAIAAMQYAMAPGYSLVGSLYYPLLLPLVYLLAYVPNWSKARSLKESRGWEVSATSFAETKSAYERESLAIVPWGWHIAALVVLAASFAVSVARYPSLPDVIPTHFDINMNPDAWSAKSWGTVLSMPIINFSCFAVYLAVGIGIVKAKMQLSPENPALSFAQQRVYRIRMGAALGLLSLFSTCAMAALGLSTIFDFKAPFWLVISSFLVPCAVLVAVTVASGQGGFKIKIKEPLDEPQARNNRSKGVSDDKFWRIGMFYCNYDDPAIMVEDRFGTGFGFNYARLPVKLGAIISIAALVGMYIWLTAVMAGKAL
ncbi:MAG: DUF1648 domain-containing protein [Clostridiales bacterium]|jgi:uncharacterized membrane protein|nr:DUF1648 domain-containing protein [Clostridiales bacterium]